MMPSLSDPLSTSRWRAKSMRSRVAARILFRALRHFHPRVGERDVVGPAFHQFGADLALELAHLHRQRRLTDCAIFCRPSEMPVASKGSQITQLTQSDHTDKLDL